MVPTFAYPPPRPPRHLHSFPTRRSSDLADRSVLRARGGRDWADRGTGARATRQGRHLQDLVPAHEDVARRPRYPRLLQRSEEHTSELQSRRDLVCRLLLEKKKENSIDSQ